MELGAASLPRGARISAPLALALCALPVALTAQDPGWIRIEEPSQWRSEVATRGLIVAGKTSIRVVGQAFHPEGVYQVQINGVNAATSMDERGVLRFVGYADPEESGNEVEVAAFPEGAAPIVRLFDFETEPPPDPADVWNLQYRGERYAVIIGISAYQDPSITPLTYADDDAQAVYDFLVSPAAGMGGFEPENVTLLLNEAADVRAMRTALYTALQPVTDRDLVFIYIAGHGAADPLRPSNYYLLPHDAEGGNLAGTALPMREFNEIVNQIRARDIIVVTDACHSGGVAAASVGLRATNLNEINRIFSEELSASGGGLVTFTAAENNQFSQESERWGGGHGVFTYYFLRGLEGAADEDRDGIVRLGEVLEYTRYEVQEETRGAQIPDISSSNFDRHMPIAVADPALYVEEERPAPTVGTGGQPPPDEAAAAAADLMSPAGTFVTSMIIPGSGQFRTGRGIRGFLVLAGALGAAGYGFVYQEEERICGTSLVSGSCPDGAWVESNLSRPYMIYGLAAAGALTFIGAIDAVFGANKVNAERRRAAGQTAAAQQQDGPSMTLFPSRARPRARAGDLPLLELRFR